MQGIDGRVALVTGAARQGGIGHATALRLAREGADIACLDIARPPIHAPDHGTGSVDELYGLVAEVEGLGRRAIALEADVTDFAAMHDAARTTRDQFGRLDLCCALAGGVGFTNGIGTLVTLPEDQWDWVIDVNLKGTWITAGACAEQMIAGAEGGRIITASSAVGLRGSKGFGAYAAAKAGVIVLTQTLALELGRYGITANAVTPGMVRTQASEPVRDHLEERGRLEGLRNQIAVGRFAEPEDVAAVIAFLCSDDAGFVTGDAINLTAGQLLG